MKRTMILPLLFFAASNLVAQNPHIGYGLNLSFPTGKFRSTSYPALVSNPTERYDAAQTEGYDVGLGAQLTVSFPIERALALRLNLNGQVTNGTNTAPGFDKINLQHSIFSLGGDLQIFLAGTASRHRGVYLISGLSADFERFESSYGDFDSDHDFDEVATERKSRLGGNFGIGHSFGYSGARFTLEATFHKTLSGNDAAKSEPMSANFSRVSIGWVF